KAEQFTADKLATIRHHLEEALSASTYKDKITVIAAGSYGRAEASPESDMDVFILFDSGLNPDDTIVSEQAAIKQIIDVNVPKPVGQTGTFGTNAIVTFNELTSNIGGGNESNQSLTRRMLFLLNDIIRYYRTIAIDFEYKISEQNKEWGLRSIKLRFSRKLIYFGGLVVAAELVGGERADKIQRANELFAMPVLVRLQTLAGQDEQLAVLLSHYEYFLQRISEARVRMPLKTVTRDNREESAEFRTLRDVGVEFSKSLEAWLKARYPCDHPIHHALLF
ncbi:MAG: nucleotidyltransferase domain-containing protein, partial [Pseudohongiella sp.]|nr:nucleotidyltransferase domain-containing protein [Pseudohongiella sp.]